MVRAGNASFVHRGPIIAEPLESRRLLSSDELTIDGTDGDDEILISLVKGVFHVSINGTVQMMPAAGIRILRVHAGDGNDQVRVNTPRRVSAVLEGGAGNDILIGGAGRDEIFGGEGEDLLNGRGGADLLDGGEGVDTVDYSLRRRALVIRLNDKADDGAQGERDNVRSNVEHVLGGWGADRIVGSAANNLLSGGGGADTLLGLDGDDTLMGGDGRDRIIGGSGNDRLDGGANADWIDSRDWHYGDSIDGGGGGDTAHIDRDWVTPWGGIGSLFGHYEQDQVAAVRYLRYKVRVVPPA